MNTSAEALGKPRSTEQGERDAEGRDVSACVLVADAGAQQHTFQNTGWGPHGCPIVGDRVT